MNFFQKPLCRARPFLIISLDQRYFFNYSFFGQQSALNVTMTF